MPIQCMPHRDGDVGPLPKQPRGAFRWLLALTAALSLATVVVAGTASSVELLQGTVTAGAATVLQNAGGTVHLEQPRIGALTHPTFFVPEPVVLWQLGPGTVLLALLYARRQRIVSS